MYITVVAIGIKITNKGTMLPLHTMKKGSPFWHYAKFLVIQLFTTFTVLCLSQIGQK